MSARNYTNIAQRMYLIPSLNATDTTTVASVSATPGGAAANPTGWPAVPFRGVINLGLADAEVVLVTTVTGSSVTFTRASQLGSAAYGSVTQTHSPSATFDHVSDAIDFAEANAHVNASSGVHGLAGAVVGTTDTQTLAAKTLTQPIIADFTNATHSHANALGGGALTSALAKPSGAAAVGLTVQGLTSQTGDLQEWQNSTPAVVAKVDASGNLTAASLTTAGATITRTLAATASAAADVVAVLKGAASQSGNLLELRNSANALLASFDLAGNLTVPTLASGQSTVTGASDLVELTVKAFSGQASDLVQTKDASGNVLTHIDSGGRLLNKINTPPVTSTSGSAATSGVADLVVLTLGSITGDGTTEVEVEYDCYNSVGTVATDSFFVSIWDGATAGSGTKIAEKLIELNGQLNSGGLHVRAVDTPAAGSHTYTARIQRNSGTGTLVIAAAAGRPQIISLRQIN